MGLKKPTNVAECVASKPVVNSENKLRDDQVLCSHFRVGAIRAVLPVSAF